MSEYSSSGSDGAVIVGQDDISNYNPDQILPESPANIRGIRAWLKPTDYSLDSGEFSKHLASHLPGTGSWLTSSETYKEWLHGENEGILWIKGIPGSGKSVIAAHLVDSLTRLHPGRPVLYFFFRQIIDANHEPAALLRDWLDQILIFSPPLQKRLMELIKSGRSISSISMEDQWSNLKLAFNGIDGQVFCIADALDEMDQGNEAFLQSLASLGQWMPSKVKVLITSRPVPLIEQILRHSRLLSIRLAEKHVDFDIASYVNHGLKASSMTEGDKDLVRAAIPGRANGLFLYAKLALDAFLEPGAQTDKVLKALPSDLHDMYTRLLRDHARRSGVPHDVQLLILQGVTHATRPLRLLELAEMLDVAHHSDSKRDLNTRKNLVRTATGPLLEILPDETVCVIHHSLTEYLKCMTRSEDDGGYPILRLGPTHGRLAIACLNYLQSGCLGAVNASSKNDHRARRSSYFRFYNPESSSITQEEQQIRLRYPFFSYANTNWHIHVPRSASAGFPQAELNTAIDNIFSDRTYREAWLKFQGYEDGGQDWSEDGDPDYSPTSLHIAARYGLCDYAQFLVETKGADVHACDASGRTPLWYAASSGHAGIIRLLVDAGAGPDVDDSMFGLKPLHKAASQNHAKAVTALLAAGVDPLTEKTRENPGRWCGNSDRSTGHTALMYACENGHLEALEAFMPFLRNVDTIHRALIWSAYRGRARLVQRILQHEGIDVNAKVRGETALVSACRSRDRDSIVALINAGANPAILCENWGREFGGGNSRHLMLFVGEKAKTHKKQGFTALHALCRPYREPGRLNVGAEEWLKLVQLLLQKGADISQQDRYGNTALHLAVNVPVALRVLLEAGADANSVNDSGKAPLHLATSSTSISLLIEMGHADINQVCNSNGQTPILKLLDSYHVDAVLKLLGYGPDLSIKDKSGNGPLHIRLKYFGGEVTVIKALLDAGADPNERNARGETPLLGMRLNQQSSLALVDTLLEAGADLNVNDVSGLTILSRAVCERVPYTFKHDHEDLEALLERGANLNVRDFDGRTLLHLAVSHQDKMFRFDYLLTKGLDVQSVDHDGNTLLHELAQKDDPYGPEHVPLAKQLIALGIDPNQPNHMGRTAIHILAGTLPSENNRYLFSQMKHASVFDLLISKSKNINQPDSQGLTALHLASTLSEFAVKKLLSAGADPTISTREGLSSLHLAARARQSNIVGQLLQAVNPQEREFVDMKDEKDHTPLYHACMSGRPETVGLLINAGANASDKKLFEACAAFETENSNWARPPQASNDRRLRKPPGAAAGLTLDDMSRPITALSKLRSSDFDSNCDTPRLDEILEMLVQNGADIHSTRYDTMSNAANAGHWYTIDCFVQAKERYPQGPDSNSRFFSSTMSVLFSEQAAKVYRDAQIRSVSESKLVRENESNSDLVSHLLKQRQYHTLEVLFNKGVKFLEADNPSRVDSFSNMQIFVQSGLASLVKRIGDLESEHQFKHGQWHAFMNKSKCGLYKELDLKRTAKTWETSPSFLLWTAVQRSLPNMEVVRLLIERFHVDVNEMKYSWDRDSEYILTPEETVLHYVAKGHNWWHVALALPYLLEQGANVNTRGMKGRTPLLNALGLGILDVGTFCNDAARSLIAAGADVNATDDKGMSCLAYASCNHELTQLLIDNGAIVDAHAIHAAVTNRQASVLETLLSAGGDPNARLRLEGKQDDTSSDVQAWGEYPLLTAAESATKTTAEDTALEMVKILLAHGANPLARFEIPAQKSVYEEGELFGDEAEELVSKELSVGNEREAVTVLHELLQNRNLVHPILQSTDLDPQTRDSCGRTLLHAACYNPFGIHAPIDAFFITPDPECKSSSTKQPSFFDALISQGADVVATDNRGRNILHMLVVQGTRSSREPSYSIPAILPHISDTHVSTLLQQVDVYGYSPLYLAVALGVIKMEVSLVEVLLNAGADPFTIDKRGRNALHILAYRICDSPAARWLFAKMLSLGLDINARDNSGQTPVFNLNKPEPIKAHYRTKAETGIRCTTAIALFEDAGADLFVTDKQGRGLLHVAAQSPGKGCAKMFELLVRKGLDAAMEDVQKRTPLDVAAACNNEMVLKLYDKDNVRNNVSAEEMEYEPSEEEYITEDEEL